MPRIKALTAHHMAKRIYDREDFAYNKKKITKQLIANILLMYMDECQKALIQGERVQISKVGSIIPEVKVHIGNFNLPMCNKEGGNPPSTKLRISRNKIMGEAMNRTLIKNIENGIYGLAKTSFSKQQLGILKKSGYIPEDAELPEDEGIIEDVEAEDYEEE